MDKNAKLETIGTFITAAYSKAVPEKVAAQLLFRHGVTWGDFMDFEKELKSIVARNKSKAIMRELRKLSNQPQGPGRPISKKKLSWSKILRAKNKEVCPACDASTNENASYGSLEVAGEFVHQNVSCKCGVSWTETYKFFNINNINDPNGNEFLITPELSEDYLRNVLELFRASVKNVVKYGLKPKSNLKDALDTLKEALGEET